MKNQFVADFNDYLKYGILRKLCDGGKRSVAICWMLTPDDGKTFGGKVDYLKRPDKWREFDPELFDSLSRAVPRNRNVRWVEDANIIPSAVFFSNLLTDKETERQHYICNFLAIAHNRDLVFFDPDKGLEVKSKPFGRKGSCEHLYWAELSSAYTVGHSILLFQYFPFKQRSAFTATTATQIFQQTGASEIFSFCTANVVFFLIPQRRHLAYLKRRSTEVRDSWRPYIVVRRHIRNARRIVRGWKATSIDTTKTEQL